MADQEKGQGRKGKRLMTTLAAAVAHPVRVRCLVILAERVASPVEISRELKMDVTKCGYHVTTLEEARLVELVDERGVRGSTEHFYRAISKPLLTAEEEADMTEAERRQFAENILSIFTASASRALEAGTLLARPDHHLTRNTITVDEDGWIELREAHMRLFDEVAVIEAAADKRLAEKEEKKNPIRVVSFQSLFEMPPVK